MYGPVENFKNAKTLIFIIVCVCIWSLLILGRLIQKQVVEHDYYSNRASRNYQRELTINAPRGVIYDRHMDPLAVSVTRKSVIVEPRIIRDVYNACVKEEETARQKGKKRKKNIDNEPCRDIPEVAALLAPILRMKPADLESKMLAPSKKGNMMGYLRVARRASRETEKAIVDLGVGGVRLEDESVREYPNNELASHVLGFVNLQGDWGSGLEFQYDRELKGTPGKYHVERDARGRVYKTIVETAPARGNSLVLSIDKAIQYITDRELVAGAKKTRARAGTAIVMESDTGRILALSNYPQIDSNYVGNYDQDLWRNRAVTDIFEPGSTFKVAVAASALKAGVVRPDDLIDCQNGAINVGGHIFRDHKPYGLMSFRRILEVSSNVGSAVLGIRLGPERLYESLRTFGFGSKTGIDLPGEVSGLVRDWRRWSGLSIGAISFGHEVGVTSVQILNAVNVIASGGYRVRPSVVDRIIDDTGNLVTFRQPEKVRILDAKTAAIMATTLEGVVLNGTAKSAALTGYRAAGKTGTAQKVVLDPVTGKRRYSNSKYVASFIGFAPLENPRITVLVQLDEPSNGYYGGDVSAPIFQKIAQAALIRLKVAPDLSLPLPIASSGKPGMKRDVVDFLPDGLPAAVVPLEPGTEMAEASPLVPERSGVLTVEVPSDAIVVPDFVGLSKRKVLDICTDMGIRLRTNGSGIAVAQEPLPGARIAAGETCTVTFAKAVSSPSQARTVAAFHRVMRK